MQYNRKAYFSLNEINSFPWKGMKEVSAGRSQLSLHELTFNLDSPQAHDCPQSWILGEWDLSSISQLLGLPMCNLRLVWFKESEYSNAVSHPFTVTPLRAKLKKTNSTWFRKVQTLSCVQLLATPRTAARQTSLSTTNSWSLPKLISHQVGDAIQLSHLPLSPSLPAFNLSQHQGLFQWVSSSYQVAKCWSFNFSISPSNDYSGLISFRVDWFDLLAVHGTLRSLLQHHSSKAPILWCSAFFMVQLSHPYMTTGNTIALTRRTGKAISLIFNMLSRLVITFLPRSKCLLISWLQSPSAVILEPQKIKSVTVSRGFRRWYKSWLHTGARAAKHWCSVHLQQAIQKR